MVQREGGLKLADLELKALKLAGPKVKAGDSGGYSNGGEVAGGGRRLLLV